MERPGRGKGFRWRRAVDSKSSVWNLLIKVFVKHPKGWSDKQWLGLFPITAIQIIPDRAAKSSCHVKKVIDRGEKVSTESRVPLAFRHNLGIATQGRVTIRENLESAGKATTMAKALPRGVHRDSIHFATTQVKSSTSLVRCENWTQRSLRASFPMMKSCHSSSKWKGAYIVYIQFNKMYIPILPVALCKERLILEVLIQQ